MMTRKDARSVPQYQVYDDEYLASQFFTGEPGYGSLPTEKEIAIRGTSHRSGFGQEIFDSSDPERYRTSTMDMRHKGMAIAGPKATAATKPTAPTAPTIVNADMELNANWTGAQGSQQNAEAHGGTYSWGIVGNLAGTNNYDVYQDLTWDVDYQNLEYTFTCWVKVPTDPNNNIHAHIILDDGVDTTESAAIAEGSDWTQATVTHTFNKAATQFRLTLRLTEVYSTSSHLSIYFDDAALSVTAITLGTTVAHADFNDKHYAGFGATLGELNSGGTGFDFVHEMPAVITSLEVFGANLFIALGTSTTCWYMATAKTFTESTATFKTYKHFKTVDAAAPVLWGSDSDNTMRSNTNPINGGAAWSGQTTIAASYDAITGMFSDSGLLYVNKEDMPYYLDSTGAVKNDLAPELGTFARSADNGKGASFWLHNFYMPWGSSLLEDNDGTLTWRSPNDFSTQLADFAGQIFAVAGDDRYLFAIVDNSTKIEVLAGRSEVIDGTARWVWHPINETTLAGCEACWVSSVYQRRLWISSTLAADSLYYIPLPVAYGNILADANRSFQTGTTMETSWLHGNFKSTIKAFIELELVMGHAYDADIYFTVKYKKLEDSSWTTIGNYTGSATSMIQSRYIPVDAGSAKPKSTLFKLQFTAVTDDTTKTPVRLGYHLKAVLYPDQREIIAMKVYCANNITLRDGGTDSNSYETIIATLDEARVATYPVTIYDLSGTARTGKFLPLSTGLPRWKPIANEANREFEREYNLLFQLIPIS